MPTTNDRVLVDTNVLLAATDGDRRGHRQAVRFLETDDRELVVTSQIVREFLSAATRPAASNGLGLDGEVAVDYLEDLLVEVDVLPDSSTALSMLYGFVMRGVVSGQQVHDAHLVAQAIHHEIGTVVTDNLRHFRRFADLISVESLAEEA
ncbi:MAG TPA: type II toxin-antitoxin system VapC family toxin [Marmoricola sp.]